MKLKQAIKSHFDWETLPEYTKKYELSAYHLDILALLQQYLTKCNLETVHSCHMGWEVLSTCSVQKWSQFVVGNTKPGYTYTKWLILSWFQSTCSSWKLISAQSYTTFSSLSALPFADCIRGEEDSLSPSRIMLLNCFFSKGCSCQHWMFGRFRSSASILLLGHFLFSRLQNTHQQLLEI